MSSSLGFNQNEDEGRQGRGERMNGGVGGSSSFVQLEIRHGGLNSRNTKQERLRFKLKLNIINNRNKNFN